MRLTDEEREEIRQACEESRDLDGGDRMLARYALLKMLTARRVLALLDERDELAAEVERLRELLHAAGVQEWVLDQAKVVAINRIKRWMGDRKYSIEERHRGRFVTLEVIAESSDLLGDIDVVTEIAFDVARRSSWIEGPGVNIEILFSPAR